MVFYHLSENASEVTYNLFQLEIDNFFGFLVFNPRISNVSSKSSVAQVKIEIVAEKFSFIDQRVLKHQVLDLPLHWHDY